jgi:hypothetical protein
MDFAKALKKTKTDAPKKPAKKQMAKLFAPDEIKEQIDIYQNAKKTKKQAEAEMSASGDIILDFGRTEQDKDGFNNDFKNAYEIEGFEETVKYVSSNRFSVSASDENQLRELFGGDFDELMEEKVEVVMKEEVLKSEELQKRIMAAVGEEFGDFFETKSTLKVREDFDKNIYKVVSPEKLPAVRTFCKPYKPSLR